MYARFGKNRIISSDSPLEIRYDLSLQIRWFNMLPYSNNDIDLFLVCLLQNVAPVQETLKFLHLFPPPTGLFIPLHYSPPLRIGSPLLRQSTYLVQYFNSSLRYLMFAFTYFCLHQINLH